MKLRTGTHPGTCPQRSSQCHPEGCSQGSQGGTQKRCSGPACVALRCPGRHGTQEARGQCSDHSHQAPPFASAHRSCGSPGTTVPGAGRCGCSGCSGCGSGCCGCSGCSGCSGCGLRGVVVMLSPLLLVAPVRLVEACLLALALRLW